MVPTLLLHQCGDFLRCFAFYVSSIGVASPLLSHTDEFSLHLFLVDNYSQKP